MSQHAHINLLEVEDSQGSAEVLLDGEVSPLRQWDLVRVSPEVVRAFAAGPDGLEIVAVGAPKPEGGDSETAPVTWPT